MVGKSGKRGLVIAIDGPSGSGKSTVSKNLAQCLGYLYIDTGAMYRAVALKALETGVSPSDKEKVGKIASVIDFRSHRSDKGILFTLEGRDVTEDIRRPDVSQAASDVSAHLGVREALWKLQREWGKNGGVVMDGRDIGTVVFPDADWKFFLSASLQERGKRRFLELREKGIAVDLAEVTAEVEKRDHQDSTRSHAPLKQAEDAISIDSSDLSVEQVVDLMLNYIEREK